MFGESRFVPRSRFFPSFCQHQSQSQLKTPLGSVSFSPISSLPSLCICTGDNQQCLLTSKSGILTLKSSCRTPFRALLQQRPKNYVSQEQFTIFNLRSSTFQSRKGEPRRNFLEAIFDGTAAFQERTAKFMKRKILSARNQEVREDQIRELPTADFPTQRRLCSALMVEINDS